MFRFVSLLCLALGTNAHGTFHVDINRESTKKAHKSDFVVVQEINSTDSQIFRI